MFVLWLLKKGSNRALFHHDALAKNNDTLGVVGHDAEISGHENERSPGLVNESFYQIEHLHLHGYVKSCSRFVCDDELRLNSRSPWR